jgi:hypothetical protein
MAAMMGASRGWSTQVKQLFIFLFDVFAYARIYGIEDGGGVSFYDREVASAHGSIFFKKDEERRIWGRSRREVTDDHVACGGMRVGREIFVCLVLMSMIFLLMLSSLALSRMTGAVAMAIVQR